MEEYGWKIIKIITQDEEIFMQVRVLHELVPKYDDICLHVKFMSFCCLSQTVARLKESPLRD